MKTAVHDEKMVFVYYFGIVQQIYGGLTGEEICY